MQAIDVAVYLHSKSVSQKLNNSRLFACRGRKMAVIPTLPSLYEYYTAGGITSGLSVERPHFTLNGKNVSVYSGATHYFRVPEAYWRDRLRKIRAAGLNTVETYVPWNLHEPQEGVYDFGDGGTDMQDFLDVQRFLELAQEEDLFVLVRPGPYICSEWEFGGLPSWLLRDKEIKIRTSQPNFMSKVTNYFNVLLPILALFQFTRGGPIIGFQIENEYGSMTEAGKFTPDKLYLEQLRQLMLRNGIVELLYTADSPTAHGTEGTLPGVLFQTANFAANPEAEFNKLKQLQKDKPSMAMEFWSGWFDHWAEAHNTKNDNDFYNILDRILKYPASVNMYMFHGGTSWGFMNGANMASTGYQPDTTSYDYDAPLTEAGDYTMKYVMVKELLRKYNQVQTRTPDTPAIQLRRAYPNVMVRQALAFNEILAQAPIKVQSPDVMPMEFLPMNNNSGQSYGYIVYRKENLNIPANATLLIQGRVCDTVMVLINGMLISKPLTRSQDLNGFGYYRLPNSTLNLGFRSIRGATLELVVENWGRNNFGYLEQFRQFKGLWQGGIYLDDEQLFEWEIVPLEFRKSWTTKLKGWHVPVNPWIPAPTLYRVTFVAQHVQDTYLNMQQWTKGVVVVNGFVLGRYASIGPQQTLYLPGPLLRNGVNEIMIFEHFYPADRVTFSANPIYQLGLNCSSRFT